MGEKAYNNVYVIWIVAFIFLFSFGYAFAGEPGQVKKVTASIVDETVIPGNQLASEGQTRNLDRFPENPESYLAMPLPDPTEYDKSDAVPLEENSAVSYDVATGQETIHETAKVLGNTPLDNLVGSNLGRGASFAASLESESLAGDRADPKMFSNLVRVGPTSSNPWRRNVRITFSMPDGNFVCSGGMIGPRTVLTAGHCVHQGGGGSWATNVVVVPAYRAGARPYGSARGIALLSWTGWTRSRQWNHDMGVIRLDRNIGSVVGWFGYGWRSSITWLLARIWNNAGYPGRSFSNTQRMFYWFGRGDWWSGLQMGINNRSFGGQSGSNAYRIAGNGRFVYFILSNGTNNWTRFPTITSTKFRHIRSFRRSAPAFDLEPLAVKVDTAASTMAYLVANNSAQSWSGTVTANVYLSKNNNISTSDTLIQTHAFEADFGPNAAVEVEVPSLTIPKDTPTGQYWVGVVLDIDDGNLKNNDSDGQDARQILMIK